MDNTQVIELFQNRGMLEPGLQAELKSQLESSGKEIGELLTDYQVLSNKEDIWPIIAQELGTELFDLSTYVPPRQVLSMVPAGLARLHGALPLLVDENGLTVALSDPFNPQTIEDLRFALGQNVNQVIAPTDLIEAKLNTLYAGDQSDAMQEVLGQMAAEFSGKSASELEDEANAAPIVRYVDLVLFQAIREKASDIHFEPFENDFQIRYRVDGALYAMDPPPAHLALSIISRVKVMANLNIAEKRVPQDGRIVKKVGDHHVDMRVSSLPTTYGESVVLRVLDSSSVNLDLEALSLPEEIDSYIRETIEKPNGIFVVTGPTGAGKTTTLYAALRQINRVDTKLLTAEDPVEYDVDGIIQIPVNEAIDLTFARVLRAFLRQDPDKILVGEIRDLETAQIAIQASLTGHLVLSTLHTNDAAGAVTRLIDMGTEPFLVAASLEGVLAQRLVRRICPDCRADYEPNEATIAQLGLSANELGDKRFYTGVGCETCNGGGYRGRRGLFELLNMSDPIKELVTERAPSVVIKHKAIELGMNTLREDGLRNIYDGTTTIEEVLKYT
ncbi:GspE/PulE family protein [Roseibacillus persicicus]|uniref:Type IV fimbrial assembly protein PilB n=1 Tax=Roseibacillus persicicus TaxID=454148 RepID=A0A918WFX9_9BACT|nr:GspE/PulE family protein [Roseibacillus persicicus]MDQ8191479.1 GspE/PulE family protein [Roseibacillus persicicus]GHC42967.1 type IV fimbrial assembly protein PilB [Roseibacillus persicicus]